MNSGLKKEGKDVFGSPKAPEEKKEKTEKGPSKEKRKKEKSRKEKDKEKRKEL